MFILIILSINLAIVSFVLHKIRKRSAVIDRFFYAYSGSLCIALVALFIQGIMTAIGGDSFKKGGAPGLLIGVGGLYFCFAHWKKVMIDSDDAVKAGKVFGWYLTSVFSGAIFGLTVFNSADAFRNMNDMGSVFLSAVAAHIVVFHLCYKTSIAIKRFHNIGFFAPVKLAFPTASAIAAYIYTKVT